MKKYKMIKKHKQKHNLHKNTTNKKNLCIEIKANGITRYVYIKDFINLFSTYYKYDTII